jgi:Tfp pilus assembly protein PilO
VTAAPPPPFWRRRLLPVFWALAGLNVAAFAAYTFPRQLQLRSVTSRVALLRAEVERQREVTAGLRRRADTIRSNAADMQRFYKGVVGSRDAELLPTLQEVEKMAAEPGLRARRRTFHPEEVKGTRLTRVGISFPVEGTYHQLVGFLARVERSPRFITVDRVALRRSAEQRGDLSIELSAYFRAGSPESHGQ